MQSLSTIILSIPLLLFLFCLFISSLLGSFALYLTFVFSHFLLVISTMILHILPFFPLLFIFPLPATSITNNTPPIPRLLVANTSGWSLCHCSTYNFCGTVLLLPLPHFPWTCSSLFFSQNCYVWCLILLDFSLVVHPSNALILTTIFRIQPIVFFILSFFSCFILFFFINFSFNYFLLSTGHGLYLFLTKLWLIFL